MPTGVGTQQQKDLVSIYYTGRAFRKMIPKIIIGSLHVFDEVVPFFIEYPKGSCSISKLSGRDESFTGFSFYATVTHHVFNVVISGFYLASFSGIGGLFNRTHRPFK